MQTTEEALVAIKSCKPGASPEERAKFLQEAGELIMFANNYSVTDFVVLANFFLLNIAFKCTCNCHKYAPSTANHSLHNITHLWVGLCWFMVYWLY